MYEGLSSLIPSNAPIVRREADMNAVVVQLMPNGMRMTSIVCKDEEMLPQLQKAARQIAWS